ncbi:C4-dicarboxylate ABC transporter substrate-binding protein [Sorangium cellulosum]|uniref:C4-dicarboxylate ABC transporter substrate-binding protein n=1 Tax=Sorangium cellulosum TaxID=56 RepID=A0A2L0ETP2_SORCE|nr:TRAP transporter substrate-binding protein [Sorangium cellulosum]AUX42663.1 C4-dicarboxylate ABC transporter substrate-binding protein [Sorangium cellulosum]
MDKKAVSFLVLGCLLGTIITSGAFSVLARPASAEGASGGQAAGAASAGTKRVVLKLSHVLDQSHPVHLAMEYMAKQLATRSSGAVELQIFPNGQLGSETESIEQVQRGALAMVKTSTAPLEGFIPEMAIFGLPYLFRDQEHYWKVLLGDVGRDLASAGTKVGVRGLCYYDSGSRSFYMRDAPIMSPADLKGRKIRVMQSKTAMDMISQLGAAPTPIAFGELYSALQQGMVDGAENNPPSLFTSRHFEVTKHYSLDEHTRIPDIILFSQKIWESLSPEVQRWIEEAADESAAFQREAWKKSTEDALAALKTAGVTVYAPDKEPFRKQVQPMYDRLEGTDIGKLVKRIQEVK